MTRPARIELEDKRSRFIASCQPLSTEDEALAFVQAERSIYPDASHHVYAWILSEPVNLQRWSDDGEPQGTAGAPLLDVLHRQGISQAGIIVTRYFGGILLGTGGLARAYGQAAAQAVEAAGPIDFCLCRQFTVTADYAGMERLKRAWLEQGWWTGSVTYGLDVDAQVAVPVDAITGFQAMCADLTLGSALIEPDVLVFRPLPLPDPPGHPV